MCAAFMANTRLTKDLERQKVRANQHILFHDCYRGIIPPCAGGVGQSGTLSHQAHPLGSAMALSTLAGI